MNVSRDLFRGSNIEAYIVVSCETVVRSGTELTCGTVGNLVSGVASALRRDWIRPARPLRGCPWPLLVSMFVVRSRALLGSGTVARTISNIRMA